MLYVKFRFKLNKLLAFKDFRDFLNIIGLGKRKRKRERERERMRFADVSFHNQFPTFNSLNRRHSAQMYS